jgi:hypothetical protein
MNWRKTALAGVAGVAAFIMSVAAFFAALLYDFRLDIVGGSAPPTLFDQLIWYVGAPALASLGGLLPMRVLGVRWQRGLLSACIAHIISLQVAIVIFYLNPDAGIALSITLGAVLTVLFATVGRADMSPKGLTVMFGVAALVLLSFGVLKLVSGLLAWSLLPAVVARVQSRSHQEVTP